jgi:hypothetical protein
VRASPRTARRLLLAIGLEIVGCARSEPALTELAEQFGFVVSQAGAGVEIDTPGGSIRARAAESARIVSYEKTLTQELRKYPRRFVELCGLTHVMLCGGLVLSGRPIAALSDASNRTIYVDVEYRDDRKSLHHELFHLFDHAGGTLFDLDWERLNPVGFRYEDHRVLPRKRPLSDLPPGFVSRNALSNPGEDKAEVFAHLMVNYAGVIKRAETDELLMRKIRLLLDRVRSRVPEMNAGFWENLPLTNPRDG